MRCASCEHRECGTGKNCTNITPATLLETYDEEDRRLAEAAAAVEGAFYMQLGRLEESVRFVENMGFTRIGVAFCGGLAEEARVICAYFQRFVEVHSVCCKVCGTGKELLGLPQIHADQFEPMCNPAIQAKILDEAGCQMHFLVGLCVGHDSIFLRHAKAPASVLVAKDRVLAHNPLGAVYSRYWRKNRLGLSD